ncbi:metal ABC transporter ATP-binding protein [soil metagenome]
MIQHVENPIIEVHDLTVSYDKKPVLWNVDFTIPGGALVGIIGPNGAGKSTLIKAIMGLLPLSSGYAHLFGEKLNDVRKRISYVPQRESVDWDFPACVMDIALMGRYGQRGLFKRITPEDRSIARQALEQVHMLEFANRQIGQLSGGQQQRVFLARALAQQADLYFMDEPFAGVDAATEGAIIELLKELKAQGKTILVVHHDLQSASEYFDWILLLNTRLVASGPAAEILTPTLLQETYGGKLSLLAQVGDIASSKGVNLRE